MKPFFGVLAVLAIVAGVLWFALSEKPLDTSSRGVAMTQEVLKGGPSTDVPHRVADTRMHEDDGLLGGNELSAGETAYLRLQLASLCTERVAVVDSSRASQGQRVDGDLCQSISESPDQGWEDFSQLDPTDPVVHAAKTASIAYELAGTDDEDFHAAVAMLDEVMRKPQGGIDGVVAAEALQQLGYVSPSVRAFAKESKWSFNDSELSQAQVVAAQMSVCGRYACSPGSLLSTVLCSSMGGCPASMPIDEVWKFKYGPGVTQAARKISEL